MTATEKMEIAIKFEKEGNKAVYDAIMNSLTADEILELLEA